MVEAILGEGRGPVAMFVQLNAPAVEVALVLPLLTAQAAGSAKCPSSAGRI
jgi:hypothetical protein